MIVGFFDTKPYDKNAFEKAEQRDVSIRFFETKLDEDTGPLCNGCDCVCVFVNDTVNKKVIDSLCKMGVRLIALRCAGYNNVDIKYAAGKIAVVRVPAYSPYAVAEHAMGMLLCSVRRIHKAYIRTRNFNFSLTGLTGFDLHGKTVGVIGTGKIGRAFIDICRGFGMRVIAYDKFPEKSADIDYRPLDEVLETSDIISLHCPLTKETYHLINENNIDRLKKGVVIINTSRGALIDAEALLAGIKNRRVGGACLDVYEEESDLFFEDFSSHIIDDEVLTGLISMPNVIVTSHQAFLTDEALDAIANTTISNIIEFSQTGKSENEIKNQ